MIPVRRPSCARRWPRRRGRLALFEFHGLNPVATRLLRLSGLNTRRLFVLLPAEGEPVAVAHRIELQPLAGFPGRVLPYARWEELHAALAWHRGGRRLAMEISPEDAVPYLDRVPCGVVELLRRLGADRWCLRARW